MLPADREERWQAHWIDDGPEEKLVFTVGTAPAGSLVLRTSWWTSDREPGNTAGLCHVGEALARLLREVAGERKVEVEQVRRWGSLSAGDDFSVMLNGDGPR